MAEDALARARGALKDLNGKLETSRPLTSVLLVLIIAVAAYLLVWGSNLARAGFVAWALLP